MSDDPLFPFPWQPIPLGTPTPTPTPTPVSSYLPTAGDTNIVVPPISLPNILSGIGIIPTPQVVWTPFDPTKDSPVSQDPSAIPATGENPTNGKFTDVNGTEWIHLGNGRWAESGTVIVDPDLIPWEPGMSSDSSSDSDPETTDPDDTGYTGGYEPFGKHVWKQTDTGEWIKVFVPNDAWKIAEVVLSDDKDWSNGGIMLSTGEIVPNTRSRKATRESKESARQKNKERRRNKRIREKLKVLGGDISQDHNQHLV